MARRPAETIQSKYTTADVMRCLEEAFPESCAFGYSRARTTLISALPDPRRTGETSTEHNNRRQTEIGHLLDQTFEEGLLYRLELTPEGVLTRASRSDGTVINIEGSPAFTVVNKGLEFMVSTKLFPFRQGTALALPENFEAWLIEYEQTRKAELERQAEHDAAQTAHAVAGRPELADLVDFGARWNAWAEAANRQPLVEIDLYRNAKGKPTLTIQLTGQGADDIGPALTTLLTSYFPLPEEA